MEPTTKSLLEYLIERSEISGGELIYFNETKSYTVRQTYEAVSTIAVYLKHFGIKSGDFVALNCTRSIDMVLIFFALQSIGAVVVLCAPHSSALEFISNSGIDLSVSAEINNNDNTWTISNKRIKQYFAIDRIRPRYTELNDKVDIKAPALIIFTSGSTGKSKGVMLSQYNYLNHVINYKPNGHYEPNDIAIQVLPLHHVFGLTVILSSMIHGYRVFFPENVKVEYVGKCIEKYKLTRIDSVPSFSYALACAKKIHNFDTSSLKVGITAGAPSVQDQFIFVQDTLGIKLLPAYGQSECVALSGAGKDVSDHDRATTVGKFLQMSKGYILDSNGNELPIGCEGEICISAPEIMIGYYNDPLETEKAIDSSGRLHTGDLGFVDEHGFLHITGRIKDIIIRNGNNLSVAGIETKLLSLPFIAQAAVVGIHDDKQGEVPAALIVVKEDCAFDKSKIAEVLTKHESLIAMKIVKEIPLTSTGKKDTQFIKTMF